MSLAHHLPPNIFPRGFLLDFLVEISLMSNVAMLITVNNPQTHNPQLANRTALPSRSLDPSANRQSPGRGAVQHFPELMIFTRPWILHQNVTLH